MPKHEKPLRLDMSFDEALRRYAQTSPQELEKKKGMKKPNKSSAAMPRSEPSPTKRP